ncbi:pyranose oxidase [Nostoc sp. CALU 546]|uniref:pyranose oxidase n=1 Tax=Nostoc sp. CALU 546 TaxID=1867241 RepID=UPI003B671E19
MTDITQALQEKAKAYSSPYPPNIYEVDALVIGSGPVGCTFARKLVQAGLKVLMIDAGAQLSQHPGGHLKNAFLYQRNVDLFASVIRGHLNTLSIPVDTRPNLTLDPGGFQPEKGFIRNGQNPHQDPQFNLSAAAATYAVGGMATHWTCATPRQHPEIERWKFIKNWDALYDEAEEFLNVHPRKNCNTHPFEKSIRHQIVLGILQEEFQELSSPYHVQNLPLACERRQDNPEFVTWSAADTVLKPLLPLLDNPDQYADKFQILEEHRCKELVLDPSGKTIQGAIVQNSKEWKTLIIRAKVYIICGGTVLTQQILFNSGIRPEPMGCYLSEQPMAFCQIVLKQEIMDNLTDSPYLDSKAKNEVENYKKDHPEDPIPIPMKAPLGAEPQVWIPVSENRPWHCQIHRDAFQYGDLPPNVDSRVIVDLRWFGIVEQTKENSVKFEKDYNDTFGMPQPTFHFSYNNIKERNQQHTMMEDMLRAAGALGGFLPPSLPQFMTPGLTLHIHGNTRMGTNPEDSVVNENSKVWGYDNLYLGGNALHPVANASNPTLTSIAIAIQSANHIISQFR